MQPHEAWRAALRARLRESPVPLVGCAASLVPGASLWVLMRAHVAWMRSHVPPASTVAVGPPTSINTLARVLAGLWDARSLALGNNGGLLVTTDPQGMPTGLRDLGPATRCVGFAELITDPSPSPGGRVLIRLPQTWAHFQPLRDETLPGLMQCEHLLLGDCESAVCEAVAAVVPLCAQCECAQVEPASSTRWANSSS